MGLRVRRHQARLCREFVEGIGGIPDKRTARLELRDHLCTHVFDGLERAYDTAALLAILGIGAGFFDHSLAGAKRVGCKNNAPRLDHALESSRRITASQRLGLYIVKMELADRARCVDGGQRRSLEAIRLGVDE